MDEQELISLRDDSLGRVLGLYDTPAYVRRGLELAESYQHLWRRCATQRDDYLRPVRMHLRQLRQVIRDWNDLRDYVASEHDLTAFLELDAELRTGSSPNPASSGSAWAIRSRLRRVCESMARFNERWGRFLAQFDLTAINRRVAAYNRYYLLEKECAMRSARLASRGFRPAEDVTREDLVRRFPFLPAPQLK